MSDVNIINHCSDPVGCRGLWLVGCSPHDGYVEGQVPELLVEGVGAVEQRAPAAGGLGAAARPLAAGALICVVEAWTWA